MSSDGSSPPAKRRRIVDSTSIGCPTGKELLEVQTVQAKIYNFADLKKQRNVSILSDKLTAHDMMWKIQFFPRGDRRSNETTEYVSVYLHCIGVKGTSKKVKAKFAIEIGPSGSSIRKTLGDNRTFANGSSSSWGWNNFTKREDVLSKCLDDDGCLEINIDIQVHGKPRVWYPKHAEQNLLYGKRLLESGVKADVTFIVGDEKEKCQAHNCILSLQAPVLHGLLQNSDSSVEIVAIPNVCVRVFKILLEHIYTGGFPKIDDNDAASESVKSILLGADRFGLTTLKLQMESEVVSKVLNTSNAAEWLLFADGHSCPLLKEACMDTCTDSLSEVKASTGWKKVKESPDLLEELLDCYANGKPIPKSNDDYDNMSVRKLREELESYDLELDGTKEMLIQRLKDNDSGFKLFNAPSEED